MVLIKNNKLRKLLKYILPLIIVGLITVWVLSNNMQNNYLLVSFAVTIISLFIFYTSYENRKIGARKSVLTSIMVVLAIVGRFIPVIKPVAALTMLSGLYLGAQSGFVVGSITAFISNFYFGQGPWTPFQMLSLGLIGFISGYLSKILQNNNFLLLLFGGVAGIFYSVIMDVFTVLWSFGKINLNLFFTAVITAIPFTLIYCGSNVLFLLIFNKPFKNKINRIKTKYGI